MSWQLVEVKVQPVDVLTNQWRTVNRIMVFRFWGQTYSSLVSASRFAEEQLEVTPAVEIDSDVVLIATGQYWAGLVNWTFSSSPLPSPYAQTPMASYSARSSSGTKVLPTFDQASVATRACWQPNNSRSGRSFLPAPATS